MKQWAMTAARELESQYALVGEGNPDDPKIRVALENVAATIEYHYDVSRQRSRLVALASFEKKYPSNRNGRF